MSNRSEIHERVLTARDKDDLAAVYREWAGDYDQDLIGELGYVAPDLTVQLLKKHQQDLSIRILDAGCGTGLAGERLKQAGLQHIEGLDYSEAMLSEAEKKKIYSKLIQGDLTGRLEIPDENYDALICVGTFTSAHVGPEAFDELIRITRKGGFICFTVRDTAWDEDQYQQKIGQMETQKQWKLVEENVSDYIQKEGSKCRICLYQVQ